MLLVILYYEMVVVDCLFATARWRGLIDASYEVIVLWSTDVESYIQILLQLVGFLVSNTL